MESSPQSKDLILDINLTSLASEAFNALEGSSHPTTYVDMFLTYYSLHGSLVIWKRFY